MGLFDRFRAGAAVPPSPVSTSGEKDVLFSPATGTTVALADIADPVFSSGILGPGLGVRPSEGVAYAPVSGNVAVVTSTSHAIAISSDEGAEVLIHVGLDTVGLRGRGFKTLVAKDEHVEAGEPLITFDRELISASGLDDTIIVTVTNADQFVGVEAACGDAARVGEPLLRVMR